jgi:signal transduction histidine kinase
MPLLLVAALSLAVAAGAWGLRSIVLRSFERLEVANAELDLRRFANGLDYEVAQLRRQVLLSIGMNGSPPEVIAGRLLAATGGSRPDIACIFDQAGRLLFASGRLGEEEPPLGQRVTEFCNFAVANLATTDIQDDKPLAGLLDADGAAFAIAVDRLQETATIVLLARHLSDPELDRIAARMEIDIDFWSMETSNLDVLEAAAGAALSLGAPIIVNRQSEELLQVYWAFQDIGGAPAFLARANVFRDLREIGDETVLLSVLAMGAVGVATILLSLILVRSMMVKRLSRLTGRVLQLRRGELRDVDLGGAKGGFSRTDEIGILAEEFGILLKELSATSEQLADVSYRAGRSEVIEGSLHNIGNALNSLLTSASAAREQLGQLSQSRIPDAARELAEGGNLSERQSKLVQYASLAAQETSARIASLQDDIERVIRHTHRIEEILDSQRRLSPGGDLAAPCELQPIVESAVQALAEGNHDGIRFTLDDSLSRQPRVTGLRSILSQVVTNLLVNAAESIVRKGETDGRIEISANAVTRDGTAMVDLCVSDNGIGLEDAELLQIFQRHYTTKQGRGHGIGLHWCAGVVASMGGSIYAISEGRNRGATLHLLLPATTPRS